MTDVGRERNQRPPLLAAFGCGAELELAEGFHQLVYGAV